MTGLGMLPGVRRGILGGTFDPPHLAHLMAGEVAYRQLDLDVVTFIPAGAPWQKADREVSDAEHRWEMTAAAVSGVPYFEADDREVNRDGWSYTVDTLESYAGDELVLILGADAASRLHTWHRWREVLDLAHVAVVPRPGSHPADVTGNLPVPVVWLDAPEIGVSGTMLRERAGEGKSIRFLVREPVWRYIDDNSVYA